MIEKILLSGGTGLLGSNLLHHLLQEGYSVYAIRRSKSSTALVTHETAVNWITVDDFDQLEYILKDYQFDYIIHAAGLVSYLKRDRDKLFRVNVDFTRRMMSFASKQSKLKKFIFISSISTLGQSQQPITESTPILATDFITGYGNSKRKAEQLVKQEAAQHQIPYIVLNPSVIIGAAAVDQSSASLIGYVVKKSPFYTKGYLNYVAVDDVSKICLQLLNSNITNEQFIVNAGKVSYKKFFQHVAQTLELKAPYLEVSPKWVYVAAAIENIISYLKRKKPTLSLETAKMANKKNTYSSEKLIQKLNFTFTPYTTAIEKTVREMREKEFIH